MKNKFTLLELLVVIVITAVLVALLLPALNLARNRAKLAVCQNNMKQIGTAMIMYCDDFNDRIPPAATSGYQPIISSMFLMDASKPVGLGFFLKSQYGSLLMETFGCDWHSLYTPVKVREIFDDTDHAYASSAYAYRETFNNFDQRLSSSVNAGKAYLMSNSMHYGSTKTPAHDFKNTNIMFVDGHIRNATNSEEPGDKFTFGETEASYYSVWNNADKL